MEMESGIHKEIGEIADEPSLTANLEKLLWQLMGTRPLLEITRESEPDAILKHQIECERTGHPRGHVPLLEAICIVGVVADVKQMGLEAPGKAEMYFP